MPGCSFRNASGSRTNGPANYIGSTVETSGSDYWKVKYKNITYYSDDPAAGWNSPAGELTIASGVITVTGNYHTVDTESDAGSDELATINGGVAGQILTLTAANSARSVVCKDGTGNLKLSGDFTLDNAEDTIMLIYNGSNWLELSTANNGS